MVMRASMFFNRILSGVSEQNYSMNCCSVKSFTSSLSRFFTTFTNFFAQNRVYLIIFSFS